MALTRMERLAAGIQADNGTVAREERLAGYENRLQDALDRQADANLRARQRRIAARREIARNDPGRFSAQETRALLGLTHTKHGDVAIMDRQERAGLRQHELDMLKQEGQNKIGVAHETALGMRGQGVEAAQIRSNVDLELGMAQHGYFDENGNYVPGSTVHAAEKTGLSRAEIERIKGESRMDVARENGVIRRDVAGINREAKIESGKNHDDTIRDVANINADVKRQVGAGHDRARRDTAGLQQQRADQNVRNRIVQDINKGAYIPSGMSPDKWNKLSFKEQQAYINGLMPNQPNNNNNPQPPARRSWRDRYEAANK